MRVLRVASLLAVIAVLVNTVEPANASCSCMRHAEDDSERAAAKAALSHLPSQSNLVTARLFAGQGLVKDAGDRYQQSADDIESELKQAVAGKLEAATGLPLDAQSFLTELAINIEEEGADYLYRAGNSAGAVKLREMAYKHMLDFSDMAPSAKLNIVTELARNFQSSGNHRKAAEYFAIVADELQRTKGRYHPATIAAQQQAKQLTARLSTADLHN